MVTTESGRSVCRIRLTIRATVIPPGPGILHLLHLLPILITERLKPPVRRTLLNLNVEERSRVIVRTSML